MAVKADTIKAIFTNLLFLIGVILIVIGFIQATSITAKLAIFQKYPLNSYEETRCDFNSPNYPKPMIGETQATVDARTPDQIRLCEESIERDRKLQMVEDITRAIGFLTSGIVIAAIFRRFIFEKK